MSALRTTAWLLLVLAALPVGLALLVGIPLGAFALLDILFEEAMLALFVPGFALYVFAICVPAGLYHAARRVAGSQSGAFRLPGVLWFGAAAAAIAVGQLLLVTRSGWLFWLCFLLAAALPPLAALALGRDSVWATSPPGAASGPAC